MNGNVYVALLHYPVYDKKGRIIATAISSLNLHDIARVSKTYGIAGFYVITPLESQKKLSKRIFEHWTNGFGATYNPTRKEALAIVSVVDNIQKVVDEISKERGVSPRLVTTAAKTYQGSISYQSLRNKIFASEEPFLIIFGTGWGIAKEIVEDADYILEPVTGVGDFNHLSVRSATAIIIDRLLGNRVGKN